jgi:hypothetical protein
MTSHSHKTCRAKRLTQNELFALLMNEIRINKQEILQEFSLLRSEFKTMDGRLSLLRDEVHHNQTTLVHIVDDHDRRLVLLETGK